MGDLIETSILPFLKNHKGEKEDGIINPFSNNPSSSFMFPQAIVFQKVDISSIKKEKIKIRYFSLSKPIFVKTTRVPMSESLDYEEESRQGKLVREKAPFKRRQIFLN